MVNANAKPGVGYLNAIRRLFGSTESSELSAVELFHHLTKAHAMLMSLSERRLNRYGMSVPKMKLSSVWRRAKTRASTAAGCYPRTGVDTRRDANTVSSLLSSLREAGLIEQANHPKDRRKRIIRITHAGRDMLKEIGPQHHAVVCEVLGVLDEDERQTMISLLRKIISSIEAVCEVDEGTRPVS
jgi:DNA-binding transcriptional ArsR family regulator